MATLFGHMNYWKIPANIAIEAVRKAITGASTGQAIFFSIAYLFVSITSLLGNALVVAAVWKDPLKTLRSSPSNFIILTLALADFLVGLVLAPAASLFYIRLAMNADPWNFLFQILLFCHFFQLSASVYHTLLLTVDRFFALARPLKYRAIVTKRRVAVCTFAIWIFGFCFASLSWIVQEHFFVLWFMYVLDILLSCEFTCCLYFITLRHLYKHHKNRIMDENSQTNQVLLRKRETKVFVVIFSIIIALDFCYTPWITTQLLFFFCQPCHENYQLWVIFYHVTTLLLSINSALNPLIYAFRFSKFKATFKFFLSKCCIQKMLGRRPTLQISEERQTYNTKLWYLFKDEAITSTSNQTVTNSFAVFTWASH